MLWNTEDMRVARKGDIERDSLRTPGLGVGVSTEALVPPSTLFFAFLLFDFGLFLVLPAFLGFLLSLLDLWSPVLEVQEPSLVERYLSLAVPLELDREGRMVDDSLVPAAFAVDNLGVASICSLGQRCTTRGLQSANQSPCASLIVALLSCLAIVPKFNITLLPLRFVEDDTRDTRLQECDGERQLDLVLTVVDSLQDDGIQLAFVELECCWVESIRGNEGGRCGDVVCERAIALTKPRLVAGLEVLMLDGD